MVKVCHLSSAHKTTDIRILKKQCVSLAKAGYEVYYVACGTCEKSEIVNGVNIVGLSFVGGRLKRMTSFKKSIYKKALEIDADIYELHDPELLPYALKLKKKGKKVIFDSHEDYPAQISEKHYLPQIIRRTISFFYEKYEKKILKSVDYIFTVSPHISERLEKINSTELIMNYPLTNIIINDNDLHSKNLCFAGNISEQWMHTSIIDAINKIDGIKYLMCGSIEDSYKEQLKSKQGWEKVEYLGILKHNEVEEKIYKYSSIGMALLTYSKNAGGKRGTLGNTKLFEYMQAGLAIICTDFDLWKEINNKYKFGLCVNPTNVNEIKNAIDFLINNPSVVKKMGENGINAINKEYNWEQEEIKLFRVYDKLQKEIKETI